MKICIVTHEYPPTKQGGGQGTYAMNLVRELISKGHDVTVIAPNEGGLPYEKKDRLEVHRLKVPRPSGMFAKIFDIRILLSIKIRRLKNDLKLNEFDLIHVLDMHDSYFITDDLSVPVIVSVNDYYSLETPWNIFKFPYPCRDLLLRYIHYNLTKVLNSRFLRKARHVISDTKYTKDAIVRVAKAQEVSVIYKGMDLKKYTGNIPEDKYTNKKILYIGGNMERKGVKYLVLALPEIIREVPDAVLTIIGKASPGYKKGLDKIINEHKLHDYINHINYCPPEKTPNFYEVANVFVLPSLIEDLGQVLMESMASKTPVVSTNAGANPEAIIHNETGLLVNPANSHEIASSVIKILKDADLAKKMGENGRNRVEKIFHSKRMLDETLAIYDKILNKL